MNIDLNSGLTLPHFCATSQPRSGFPSAYVVILFVFSDLRWEREEVNSSKRFQISIPENKYTRIADRDTRHEYNLLNHYSSVKAKTIWDTIDLIVNI
jgi:hypothetical protein